MGAYANARRRHIGFGASPGERVPGEREIFDTGGRLLGCSHPGSYLRFLRRPATPPLLLIAAFLAFGCDSGLLVEGAVKHGVGASSALHPVAGPQPKLGDHDPEAKVYDSLRPKAEVLAELKSGECLAHFARAGSDKFWPSLPSSWTRTGG